MGNREFDTGATRDTDADKLDFEGAVSPSVLWEFAKYMRKHTIDSDGNERSSDNWQKGFPDEVLMKSLLRHVMDLWLMHRGYDVERPESGESVTWDDAFGGAFFNLQAMWHQYAWEQAVADGMADA